MKNVILFAVIIFTFTVNINAVGNQLIGGDYGDVNHYPFTGDIYGTTLNLMNIDGSWSGLYHNVVAGHAKQILNECIYDKTYFFHY